jgi:hypothetical protein
MEMKRLVMSKKKIKPDRMVAERVSEQVFSLSDDIRSVAMYFHGKLGSVSRPNPSGLSWWDSDKYEEIIVNPTLLTLLRQRGNIDCGGIQHIVIHYGNFTQIVHPINGGHISVGFVPKSDYARFIPRIKKLLSDKKLIVKNENVTIQKE